MTNDLEELKNLARDGMPGMDAIESATGEKCGKRVGLAILSLIQRVREAERTGYYHPVDRPVSVDANSLAAWLNANKKSNLGSMACALADVFEATRADGRAEALEEAAKVADSEQGKGDTSKEFDDGWNGAAMLIATAIRALKRNT